MGRLQDYITRAKARGNLPGRVARQSRLLKLWQHTPHWITPEQRAEMLRIYRSCPHGHTVDHIVPLDGKMVCGLHVPWNLAHLERRANGRKSNKFWPGCPFEQGELLEHDNYIQQQTRLL